MFLLTTSHLTTHLAAVMYSSTLCHHCWLWLKCKSHFWPHLHTPISDAGCWVSKSQNIYRVYRFLTRRAPWKFNFRGIEAIAIKWYRYETQIVKGSSMDVQQCDVMNIGMFANCRISLAVWFPKLWSYLLSVVLTVELTAVCLRGGVGVVVCSLTQAGAGTWAFNDGVFAGVVEDWTFGQGDVCCHPCDGYPVKVIQCTGCYCVGKQEPFKPEWLWNLVLTCPQTCVSESQRVLSASCLSPEGKHQE